MLCVQLVPPARSALISPAWSMQKPLCPDFPTACGTAVTSYEVNMSCLLTVTLGQLTILKVEPDFCPWASSPCSTSSAVGLGGPALALPPSAASEQAKPLAGKLV